MLSCCMTDTTVGIIIGSIFTLLGVIINGIITFYLNSCAYEREIEEKKRSEQKTQSDANKAKKEKAYRDFAVHYGFMNFLLSIICAPKDIQINRSVFESIFWDKFKVTLAKASEVLSEVLLYGSKKVFDHCERYVELWSGVCRMCCSLTLENCVQLDRELQVVVGEMKKELGLDNL